MLIIIIMNFFIKQAIKLIFEKLDVDSDGLINFEEFLNFFQTNKSKYKDQLSTRGEKSFKDNINLGCNQSDEIFLELHQNR